MKFQFKRLKQYTRDVSIVVIGILVTFAGSDIIDSWNKKKEVKAIMELIKDEISYNLINVEGCVTSFQNDSLLLTYLAKNENRISEIPADSLGQIKKVLTHITGFQYKKNAFELLKNTSLMQHVNDKELLLSVIEAYDAIEIFDMLIKIYIDMKFKITTDPYRTLQKKEFRDIQSTNLKFIQFALSNPEILQFIDSAPYLFETSLSSIPLKLHTVIELIDKKS